MKKALGQITLLLLFIVLVSFSGCKKNTECKAGTGGDLTFVFYPQHHGIPITSSQNYRDTILIKFEATDFPGASQSLYDKIVIGNANENFVTVSGMKCGQYYFVSTGFDTTAIWNVRVIGGLPYNISETSGSKSIVMAVNE